MLYIHFSPMATPSPCLYNSQSHYCLSYTHSSEIDTHTLTGSHILQFTCFLLQSTFLIPCPWQPQSTTLHLTTMLWLTFLPFNHYPPLISTQFTVLLLPPFSSPLSPPLPEIITHPHTPPAPLHSLHSPLFPLIHPPYPMPLPTIQLLITYKYITSRAP